MPGTMGQNVGIYYVLMPPAIRSRDFISLKKKKQTPPGEPVVPAAEEAGAGDQLSPELKDRCD